MSSAQEHDENTDHAPPVTSILQRRAFYLKNEKKDPCILLMNAIQSLRDKPLHTRNQSVN